jgi:site-specific recombinase XerD
LIDPFEKIEIPRRLRTLPAYLTQAEVRKLLLSTPTHDPAELRDRAVLETLYSSGLRVGELVRLDLTDVDLCRGLILVRMGKGKKDRVVPLGRIAATLVSRYVGTARVPAPSQIRALFLNDHGQRLTYDAIRSRILGPALLRARIARRVTPHVLRHSCAVHLLENGASVRHVQALLGHAKLATTQRYLLVVPVKLKAVHRATHPAERRPRPEPTEPSMWVRGRRRPKPQE